MLGVPVLLVPLVASSELAVPAALFASSTSESESLRKTVFVEMREALRARWHAVRASGDACAVHEFWRVHCAPGSEPDLECEDVWAVASRVQLRGAWSLLALALHDAGTAFELGGTLQWNGTCHASVHPPDEQSRRDELHRFACALILKATLLNASEFPAEESDDEGTESTRPSGGRTTSAGGASAQAKGTSSAHATQSIPAEQRRRRRSARRHLLRRPGVVRIEGVGEFLLSDEVPSLLCDQRCHSPELAGGSAQRCGSQQEHLEKSQEQEEQIEEEEEEMHPRRQAIATEEEEDREREHADGRSYRGFNPKPASARADWQNFAFQSVAWLGALGRRVLGDASSRIVSRVVGWPVRLVVSMRWLPRAAAAPSRSLHEGAGSHKSARASAQLQRERQQQRSMGEGASPPAPKAAASAAPASGWARSCSLDASATIAVDSRRAEGIDHSSSTSLEDPRSTAFHESVSTTPCSLGDMDGLQDVPLFASRSCSQALAPSGASRAEDSLSAPAQAHSFEALSSARGCAARGGVALGVGDGRCNPLGGMSPPSQPPKFQRQLPAAARASLGAGRFFPAAAWLSRGSRGSLPSGSPPTGAGATELAAVPVGSRSSRLVMHSWQPRAVRASVQDGSEETAPLRQVLRTAAGELASRGPCSSSGSAGSLPSSGSSSSGCGVASSSSSPSGCGVASSCYQSMQERDRHSSDESDFYRLDQLMAETRPRPL
jgi:hypothetical protein